MGESREPMRFTARMSYGGKVDPEQCAAAVHEGGRGVGFRQCLKSRVDGSDWCRTHKPAVVDPERAVYAFYDGEVHSCAVTKETAKRVWLAETKLPWKCRSSIAKEEACWTAEEAWERRLAELWAALERNAAENVRINGEIVAAEAALGKPPRQVSATHIPSTETIRAVAESLGYAHGGTKRKGR